MIGIGLVIAVIALGNVAGIAQDLAREEAVNLGNAMVAPPCLWAGTCAEYDPTAKQTAQTLWNALAVFGGLLTVGGIAVTASFSRADAPAKPLRIDGSAVPPKPQRNFCTNCGQEASGSFCSNCGVGINSNQTL